MLARDIRTGWQVTPERKRDYFDALDRVVANLDSIEDPAKRAQAAASCVSVLVAEQSIAMRDLHHIEKRRHEDGILDLKMTRAEQGKPNDCIAVQVTPVRELPMPASLAGLRKRILESGEN